MVTARNKRKQDVRRKQYNKGLIVLVVWKYGTYIQQLLKTKRNPNGSSESRDGRLGDRVVCHVM